MRNDFYPQETVQQLLQTDLVTSQTKKVLQQRLQTPKITEPSFFTEAEFTTLQAVCNRLLPQPAHREQNVDFAGILDTNFKEGKTDNGWRYNAMPPDDKAFKLGLAAIEQTAVTQYGHSFHLITIQEEDSILSDVQAQKVMGDLWNDIPSHFFFKELLALLCEIYYSHPTGKNEIGDASMADANGWHRIQLNELEKAEPPAVSDLNS